MNVCHAPICVTRAYTRQEQRLRTVTSQVDVSIWSAQMVQGTLFILFIEQA